LKEETAEYQITTMSSPSNATDGGSIPVMSSSRPSSPIFNSQSTSSIADHSLVPPSSLIYRCGTILTNSKIFQDLVCKAFQICDDSGDGVVDEAELYAGLLLVHLNLAKHAGPAACYPPTRIVCDRLFEAADKDNSGGLDKQQFHSVMCILCVQILSRMLVYYMVLILCVPILASHVIFLAQIPEGTFLELATRESVSIIMFFLAVPVLWNKIDARYSGSDAGGNPNSGAAGTADADNSESPALLLPSKRQEQRQRRRRRKNPTPQSHDDGETSI